MRGLALLAIIAAALAIMSASCYAGQPIPRPCTPEYPIPAESMGPLPVPFDVPIWPTLVKTEFHIIPWVSLGSASVCIPGTCRSLEIPFPSFSLKPLPVWFPWLRPIDVEFKDCEPRPVP